MAPGAFSGTNTFPADASLSVTIRVICLSRSSGPGSGLSTCNGESGGWACANSSATAGGRPVMIQLDDAQDAARRVAISTSNGIPGAFFGWFRAFWVDLRQSASVSAPTIVQRQTQGSTP